MAIAEDFINGAIVKIQEVTYTFDELNATIDCDKLVDTLCARVDSIKKDVANAERILGENNILVLRFNDVIKAKKEAIISARRLRNNTIFMDSKLQEYTERLNSIRIDFKDTTLQGVDQSAQYYGSAITTTYSDFKTNISARRGIDIDLALQRFGALIELKNYELKSALENRKQMIVYTYKTQLLNQINDIQCTNSDQRPSYYEECTRALEDVLQRNARILEEEHLGALLQYEDIEAACANKRKEIENGANLARDKSKRALLEAKAQFISQINGVQCTDGDHPGSYYAECGGTLEQIKRHQEERIAREQLGALLEDSDIQVAYANKRQEILSRFNLAQDKYRLALVAVAECSSNIRKMTPPFPPCITIEDVEAFAEQVARDFGTYKIPDEVETALRVIRGFDERVYNEKITDLNAAKFAVHEGIDLQKLKYINKLNLEEAMNIVDASPFQSCLDELVTKIRIMHQNRDKYADAIKPAEDLRNRLIDANADLHQSTQGTVTERLYQTRFKSLVLRTENYH